MMPLQFSFSIINRISPHAHISKPNFKVRYEDTENDIEALEQCINLSFDYDKIIWPYFGQMHVSIEAPDTLECRKLDIPRAEISVRFFL